MHMAHWPFVVNFEMKPPTRQMLALAGILDKVKDFKYGL
jgi:hypothetical protein